MGASNWTGPLYSTGDLEQIEASPGGAILLPDPNPDRGPNGFFAGYGLPDVRFTFLKDKVQGYTGVVPLMLARGEVSHVNTIPILHAINNIAAAAVVASGTAMTLVSTAASGITLKIPVIPFTGSLNSGSVVTTAIALDWGFAFGTVTSGSKTVVVADSTMFVVGMPLVIAHVADSSNGALLTNVASITDATHIVIADTPAASKNPTPIGTGNIWGPSENGYPTPTAYAPYLAFGPGLFLDPRQALGRGVVITCNNSSGVGGAILVSGYDVYGMAMSEAITITPGSALTAYGKKAFKFIASVVPQFTDATYTYAIGTSDVFGFNMRQDYCEDTEIWWAGALNAATTGFVAPDATSPATTTTGDVRGTIQTSAIGGGSGIGSTASNGSVSALALSGRRLKIAGALSNFCQLNARLTQPQFMYGISQI